MTVDATKQTIYDADFRQGIIGSRQPVWLKSIRKQAFKFFTANGFPSVKNEDWKYTNVAPIAKEVFDLATGTEELPAGISEFLYPEAGENTLVFVNGILNEERSKIDSSFTVLTLNAAFKDESAVDVIQEYFGKAVDFSKNGFTAFNVALLSEGIFLHIPKNARIEAPIHLLFVSTDGKVNFPRVLIVGEQGSVATIVESYASAGEGKALTNSVTEIFLKDEARLDHFRVQKENPESFNIGETGVVLGRASYYNATNINLGASLSRHDVSVKFTAEGGECFVDGLYMLNGSQHSDTHSVIDHTVPHCTSHQNYKGVMGDRSHAVFNGKVLVRENARGTDAQQSNKNLLLSNDARVDTKPQLEIFNDDVKCAHGATVGQLEDEEVFYLLSRGLHPELARNLLTYGFAEEVISKIAIVSMKNELDKAVLNRLAATLEV